MGPMFKKLIICAVFVCAAAAAVSQTPVACSNMSVGANGALNGFVPSPNDAWHQDITNAPVDPGSAKIITTSGDLLGASLHADFSSIAGGGYGIPYTVVDSQQTPGIAVPITLYPDESDITLIPIPATLPVEESTGECSTSGDRHALVVDRNKCVVYEMSQAVHCNNAWSATQMTVWDFTSTEQRPYTYTSTDAAGLSVFEGLIRYDEIVAGSINHAIRFTAQHTKDDANNGFFTAPATHAAGNLWGTDNIMGMRIRLKASFDISGFSSTNQIILKAMKQYGMILADNGSNLFFQGTPDARWNDSDLNALRAVPSSAFDVVQMAPVYDSATAPKGAAPVISSFTASATTVASGASVTLTPTVTGASYSYIDKAGFVRGPVVVNPTATTTYTLTSRNAYGTKSASVTVTVQAGTAPTLQIAPVSTQTYGAASFAVSATSNSAGAITYSVVGGPATVSGSMVTLTGVGTVTLQASQAAAGSYTAGTAQTSFVVSAGSSTLAFVSVPNQTFGAAPFVVSTTTKSAGSIAYSVVSGSATVSGNQVTLTGTGTVTLQANQAAAGNYTAATATTAFTVAPGATALTFAAIPAQTFGAAPFSVTATSASASASSGAITYSVVSGPATIGGNTVTVTGAGTVILQANQAAAGNYAAGTAQTGFTVSPGTPALAFVPIAGQTTSASPILVSATSQSSGSIAYSVLSGPATINGSTVTITGAGTVMLQANQVATGSYAAATATTAFSVTTATGTTLPKLAFVANWGEIFGAAPFTVTASSASSGVITYSIASGPATINGNTVTLTGAGTLVVRATQAATSTYASATTTMSIPVKPGSSGLAFVTVPVTAYGSAPFPVAATTNSSGAIVYSVTSGPATISGNMLTLTGIGTVHLQATQAATTNYVAATSATYFNVAAQVPTITFAAVADQTFGNPAITLNASSNSPAPFTYTVIKGWATVSGNTVTLAQPGALTIQAHQAAVGNFGAATANVSFNVAGEPVTLAFAAIPAKVYGTSVPFVVSATSASSGVVSYSVVNGPATISGHTVTLTGSGTVTLAASQPAGGNYAAGTATTSFTAQ
jgi:hypothetical protein